jgi:hypothetical protein
MRPLTRPTLPSTTTHSSSPSFASSRSLSLSTEQKMYSALQLQLPSGARDPPRRARERSQLTFSSPASTVEDMNAYASASTSPAPMSYYHPQPSPSAAATAASYASVPAIPQELMVDPGLYYQGKRATHMRSPMSCLIASIVDHGHGHLQPMPFVTIDISGRSASPQSADALSSGSHSPYGTPEWHHVVPSAQPAESYYLPGVMHDYDWSAQAAAAGPSTYPYYEEPRSHLTIDTSLPASYLPNASYYSHPSSATSASSGSPVSSPPLSLLSPLSDSSETRAPASGPARGGRRKGAAGAGAPKKVHRCTLCQKTMSRNYDLHRHLLSVHGIGERVDADGVDRKGGWGCSTCGKCFSRKDSMQRHQRDDGCRTQGVPSSRGPSSDREVAHAHLSHAHSYDALRC